jgi:hypothetical protein
MDGMQTGAAEPEASTPELVPLNVIRVETALSRYPVHRLAKQGTIDIEIREQSEDGELLIRWEVDSSRRYGQPGPLAYKVDTLIVNRRIEEASKPVPKIIKLGSLHDICRELGVSEGKNILSIKKALYQNASAFIVAKLRYSLADGTKKELEAGFSRYSVVFTGEELPDGRKADGVYLVLNDVFMQVINGAQTRPLDYEYLKDLPPGSQRLYEILSYRMYAALKNGRPRAKLSYGDFCTHAPLTRHTEWLRVRTQMNKLHAPHKKSGYIQSVEFEQTTDQDGKPDWSMLYTPGPKARAEFRTFDKKGGPKTLFVEQSPPALEMLARQVEPTPLERELIARGVMASTAATLVGEIPEEQISRQVEHFDWLKAKSPKSITKSPGGFLADAIRRDYPTPPGFETKAQRATRDEAKREKERQEAETRRLKEESRRRDFEAQDRINAYLAGLSAQEQEQLEAEALEEAEPGLRASLKQASDETMQRLFKRVIREAHVRRKLGLPVQDEN